MPKTEEVVEYLKQHPSFFEENQELLTYLELNAENGATPFHERQLKILKDRESHQQSKIDLIVDSAKNNQRLESDILEMAIGLLSEGQNGKQPSEVVIGMVKRQFNVNQAVILFKDTVEMTGHPEYEAVSQRVIHKGSICDDRVSSKLLQALFDREYTEIKSCAFVPLVFSNEINGVMVLGSDTEERFQPGIGVMFLDRLGLLVGGYFEGAS